MMDGLGLIAETGTSSKRLGCLPLRRRSRVGSESWVTRLANAQVAALRRVPQRDSYCEAVGPLGPTPAGTGLGLLRHGSLTSVLQAGYGLVMFPVWSSPSTSWEG